MLEKAAEDEVIVVGELDIEKKEKKVSRPKMDPFAGQSASAQCVYNDTDLDSAGRLRYTEISQDEEICRGEAGETKSG